MNPSTAMARVIVDELIAAGVGEIVLAPGSRSASLALAIAAAVGPATASPTPSDGWSGRSMTIVSTAGASPKRRIG